MEWKQIEYNLGNHFDGTIFTTPRTGLYHFSATVQVRNANATSYFYVNDQEKFFSRCRAQSDDIASLPIQTTLKLETGDKVTVRYDGQLYEGDYRTRAFFEGRLISKIDE